MATLGDMYGCQGLGWRILLLDWPKQTAGFVQVRVVVPRPFRIETLPPATASTAPIRCAVRAGAVPSETDEEGAVVTIVRRPVFLL